MPWDRIEEHADLIRDYAALSRVRHDHVALGEGGLRWLAATDDAIAFVRESRAERVLVVAARRTTEVSFALHGAADAKALFGDIRLTAHGHA